jgi:uncharacterized protein YndB with AHSA1/START domain
MTAATLLLEFRTEFAAPPARVFAALTEADLLAHWLCDAAESEPLVGGRVTLRWSGPEASPQPFEGHWVVFQRPFSCAFDGGHAGYPDGHAGRVGFELAAGGAGTVLITRHRMPQRPDYEPIAERYRAAWPRALARLSALLAPAPVEPAR